MNKIIYCNVCLYELHQRIYLVDLDTSEVSRMISITTIEDLETELISLCNKYNISNVHLIGNQEYLTTIAETIMSNGKTQYNKNINVEVNKNV